MIVSEVSVVAVPTPAKEKVIVPRLLGWHEVTTLARRNKLLDDDE